VQIEVGTGTPQLRDVTAQGDGVDCEVLRCILPLTTQVNLHGPPFDGSAHYLLELGFQKVVWLRCAERNLEIAIVKGPEFDRQGQSFALEGSVAITRHAQQHSHLPTIAPGAGQRTRDQLLRPLLALVLAWGGDVAGGCGRRRRWMNDL